MWRPSSTCTPAPWSAGPSLTTCAPIWSPPRSTRPSPAAARRPASSSTATAAVHVRTVRPVLHQAQDTTVTRPDRYLLRQRCLRVVLRDVQEGTHPSPPLANRQDREEGDVRLDRNLLQHHPPPLHPRILDTRRIRTRLQTPQPTGSLKPLSKKAGTLQYGVVLLEEERPAGLVEPGYHGVSEVGVAFGAYLGGECGKF